MKGFRPSFASIIELQIKHASRKQRNSYKSPINIVKLTKILSLSSPFFLDIINECPLNKMLLWKEPEEEMAILDKVDIT